MSHTWLCDTGLAELGLGQLSALECLYVANDLKPVSLIFLKEGQIARLEPYCTAHQLCFELSDYKMLMVSQAGKGRFSNSCIRVPAATAQGEFGVFLAKDPEQARMAKYYYAVNDHIRVAALFGYPRCCARFFARHAGATRDNDYILATVRDLRRHPFLNNRALRYFDISLLSHFPCTLDCPASAQIARARLAFLRETCPEIGARFEKQLRAFVIYTEEQGIFYASDYAVAGRHVTYERLQGTIQNDLFGKLGKAGGVEVISPWCLMVEGKKVDAETGVLFFE